LYFFHRYQVEAATKVVGGLDYNYAVKGDGQITTEVVDAKIQKEALNSIITALEAETLAIPKEKLNLFPPRAFGYGRSRESFVGKTGVAFDALSTAATASDISLRLLLNPQRANRLIQQQSINNKQLGLEEVLNTLIDNSFKKSYSDTYLNEVQQSINVNVLKYIMNLAVNTNSYFQVNAIANKVIDTLAKQLDVNDTYELQHLTIIKRFIKDPKKFSLQASPRIPDGSPIGSDICAYNDN